MSRIFIFNHDLSVEYPELIGRTTRAWMLNAPAQSLPSATVTVPVRGSGLTKEHLTFRNILVIVDGVLPVWVGQIGEPQSGGPSEVKISATAAEIILEDRRPITDLHPSMPGVIFEQLIADANLPEFCGVILGDVEDGDVEARYHRGSKNIFSSMELLQMQCGFEWGIDGALPEGEPPQLRAWLRRETGDDYTGESPSLTLAQGVNIKHEPTADLWVRSGRVKNDGLLEVTSGVQTRAITGLARNEESIGRFGLAQGSSSDTAKNQVQADRRVAQYVAEHAFPSLKFAITANDPSIYPYLRIGNRFPLVLTTPVFEDGSEGFEGNVRIIGMAHDDMVNEVELNVEIVE